MTERIAVRAYESATTDPETGEPLLRFESGLIEVDDEERE